MYRATLRRANAHVIQLFSTSNINSFCFKSGGNIIAYKILGETLLLCQGEPPPFKAVFGKHIGAAEVLLCAKASVSHRAREVGFPNLLLHSPMQVVRLAYLLNMMSQSGVYACRCCIHAQLGPCWFCETTFCLQGFALLHFAVFFDQVEMVTMLVSHGAFVDVKDLMVCCCLMHFTCTADSD